MLEQLKDEDSPADEPTFMASPCVLPNLETYSHFRNANWDLKQIFQTLEETPANVYKEIDGFIKQMIPQVENLPKTNLIRKFIVNADTILRFFEYASNPDRFQTVVSPTNQWLIELMKIVAPDFLRIIDEMAGTAESLGKDVKPATGPASADKTSRETQTEASSSLPGLAAKREETKK